MGSCCSKVTPEGVANENSITQKHGGYGYGKTSVAAGGLHPLVQAAGLLLVHAGQARSILSNHPSSSTPTSRHTR